MIIHKSSTDILKYHFCNLVDQYLHSLHPFSLELAVFDDPIEQSAEIIQ